LRKNLLTVTVDGVTDPSHDAAQQAHERIMRESAESSRQQIERIDYDTPPPPPNPIERRQRKGKRLNRVTWFVTGQTAHADALLEYLWATRNRDAGNGKGVVMTNGDALQPWRVHQGACALLAAWTRTRWAPRGGSVWDRLGS
jgi:hypothetical protein